MLGASAANFVLPSIAPTVLQARTPLTFRDLRVDRMTSASRRFDSKQWTRDDGLPPYFLNVDARA